jgi:ABC-type uncharacterized transport system permease subunit
VDGLAFQSAWIGWIVATLVTALAGLVYAFFVIELKADQIVTGTAVNLFVTGLIPLVSKSLYNSTGSTPSLNIDDRFSFEPILLALILTAVMIYWFYHTYSGLWVRFAGDHPLALLSSGVSAKKVRYLSVMMSGALAGMGGASLSLFLSSSYSPMMSGGRGFMALAAMIFGKWKPLPTFIACLFFGFAETFQIRLQGLHIGSFAIPVQFIQILPYILTILAVSGWVGKSQAPKYLGKSL